MSGSNPDLRARRRPLGRLVALLGLLFGSPLLGLAAIAIKLSSRGPVLYRATRAGLGGHPFTMFKFRTMHEDRRTDGERITASNDPRVFRAGRWLRRVKLDELPQLLNVVAGQMALVGPRPEDFTIAAEHYTAFMMETLEVLPGLTSPGTLSYLADEAALPDSAREAERIYLAEILPVKIALDLVYVHNRSWRYDAELMLRTVASIVGAHRLFARRQAWERAEAQRLLAANGHSCPKAVAG